MFTERTYNIRFTVVFNLFLCYNGRKIFIKGVLNMPTELFLNVPLPYAICLAVFVILSIFQLCLLTSINETTKQRDKQTQELKEQNDLLVKSILEMLDFRKNTDKEQLEIANKNVDLLNKISDTIEKRG
jgi:hypothetical protein